MANGMFSQLNCERKRSKQKALSTKKWREENKERIKKSQRYRQHRINTMKKINLLETMDDPESLFNND
jgi:hypothetical protein